MGNHRRQPQQSRLELGCVSGVDSNARTIFVAEAHRDDGKRFVVRSEEKLTAFLELEKVVRKSGRVAKLGTLGGIIISPDSTALTKK
jgi:hypothetical protein